MTDLAALIRSTPPREPIPYAAEAVIATTARMFGLTPADLTGRCLSHPTVQARQVAMTVIRATTALSYPAIASLFDDRDHHTVMSNIRKVMKTPTLLEWASAVDLELTMPTPSERRARTRRHHHGGTR